MYEMHFVGMLTSNKALFQSSLVVTGDTLHYLGNTHLLYWWQWLQIGAE